jgi:NDP-sugar pyrophosphorylase family protein
MLKASDLFDLNRVSIADLFEGTTYVWEAIPRIAPYIQARLSSDRPANGEAYPVHSSVVIGAGVHIGEGTQIDPGVYIEGPALIGKNCHIRHGAYVRSNTILCDGGLIGHATETKNAILLEGSSATHFAYVGDSILGRDVNLGAGVKLSNFAVTAGGQHGQRNTIKLLHEGEVLDTGLVKIGAIIGDNTQLGCNAVCNPGVIIGRDSLVYALASLNKGIYPARSVIKLRQTLETVDRRF